jgi:hypothetical protein
MLYALALIVPTAAWVGFDARKFDWSGSGLAKTPLEWAAGCLLLWIVIFPVYLVRRRQVPRLGALVVAGGPESLGWSPPALARVPCRRCATPVHPMAQVCQECGARVGG